jgi:hypothetical protein
LEVFLLLSLERKVKEKAQMHNQLQDRAEDENSIAEFPSDGRHQRKGDDRENRRQDETYQIMMKFF